MNPVQKTQQFNFIYNSDPSHRTIIKRTQTLNFANNSRNKQVVRVASPINRSNVKIPLVTKISSVQPSMTQSRNPGRYYSGYEEQDGIDSFEYRIYKITNSLINQITGSINEITKAQIDKLVSQKQWLGDNDQRQKNLSKMEAESMFITNNQTIKYQMKQLVKQVTYLNQNKKQPRTVWLDVDIGQPPNKKKQAGNKDNYNPALLSQYLKQKVYKITSDVLSVSFNLHFKDGMEYNKVKAYCSQNFLYNFCKLAKATNMSSSDMKEIEQLLQEYMLPYLNLSYPRSQQRNMNKELKSKIKEKDVFNENRFDLVFNSGVQLSLKQIQTNAQVMRIMNYIIKLPDEKPQIQSVKTMVKMNSLISQNQNYLNVNQIKTEKGQKIIKKASYNSESDHLGKLNQSITSNNKSENNVMQNTATNITETKKDKIQIKTYYQFFEEDMDIIYNKVFKQEIVRKLYKMNQQEKKSLEEQLNKMPKQKTSKKSMQLLDSIIIKRQQDIEKAVLDQQKRQKLQLEYKQKVQNYTKFLIGRKVSGNTTPYTNAQIEEGSIIIKDSAVARILMKWVEALEEQINDPSKSVYLRDQPFRLHNKQENYQLSSKQNLKRLYNFYQRSSKIIKQKSQVLKNNARQVFIQALRLFQKSNSFSEYKTFSSDKDALVGHICTWVQKSKQSHISTYLCMLINQIKRVQQQYERMIEDKKVNISSSPALVNLKLGDLMRCLIVSKPRQIIALYQYIDLLCKYDSERFELVRVKDRSNTPNKDILINIFYYKKIMIEIQLAIKNDSQFLNCSDKFSHFIYQMERAFLGPVNQMCSIWSQYSPKSQFFFKRFNEINIRQKYNKKPKCDYPGLSNQHDYYDQELGFMLPFLCSSCEVFYSTGSVLRKICRYCKLYRCNTCQIRHSSIQKQQQFIKNYFNQFEISPEPQVGKIYYGLDITSAHFHLKTLIKVQINGKITVYSMNIDYKDQNQHSDQIQQIRNIKKSKSVDTTKDISTLVVKNIVQQYEISKKKKHAFKKQQFEFSHIFLDRKDANKAPYEKLTDYEKKYPNQIIKQILKNHYLPSRMNTIIKKAQRFMKLSIIVNPDIREQIKGQIIQELIKKNRDKLGLLQKLNLSQSGIKNLDLQNSNSKIRVIVLTGNFLQNMNLKGYNSLVSLQISHNRIQSITMLKDLKSCKQLKKLLLDHNKLRSLQGLPKQLQNLQTLSLSNNQIQELQQIPYFQGLKSLNISHNNLQNINGVKRVIKLQQLKIKNNPFLGIDAIYCINSLSHLRVLDISSIQLIKKLGLNNSMQMNSSIRSSMDLKASVNQNLHNLNSLQFLEFLNASYNELKSFPEQKRLKNIKQLDFSHNKLEQIQCFTCYKQLRWLNLRSNSVKSLKGISSLKKLEWLNLSKNLLTEQSLGQIQHLKNLHELALSHNNLNSIQSIGQLPKLYELNIRGNKLRTLQNLSFPNLNELDASFNCLKDLNGVQNFKNLSILKLSSNRNLKDFQKLYKIRTLRCLKINNIGLTEIEESITKLNTLHQLYVTNNNLLTLKGIQQLKSLKKLQIFSNNIKDFSSLNQMKFLSQLSVSLKELSQYIKFKREKKLQSRQKIKREEEEQVLRQGLRQQTLSEKSIKQNEQQPITILNQIKSLQVLNLYVKKIIPNQFEQMQQMKTKDELQVEIIKLGHRLEIYQQKIQYQSSEKQDDDEQQDEDSKIIQPPTMGKSNFLTS